MSNIDISTSRNYLYTLLAGFVLLFAVSCEDNNDCLLYTSPSPRDATLSRMPSSA